MVRIATAQLFLDVTNPQDCVDVSTLAIKTAISAGAKIIVLPELSNSGYLFESHDEVKLSAATLDSPFILEWL